MQEYEAVNVTFQQQTIYQQPYTHANTGVTFQQQRERLGKKAHLIPVEL